MHLKTSYKLAAALFLHLNLIGSLFTREEGPVEELSALRNNLSAKDPLLLQSVLVIMPGISTGESYYNSPKQTLTQRGLELARKKGVYFGTLLLDSLKDCLKEYSKNQSSNQASFVQKRLLSEGRKPIDKARCVELITANQKRCEGSMEQFKQGFELSLNGSHNLSSGIIKKDFFFYEDFASQCPKITAILDKKNKATDSIFESHKRIVKQINNQMIRLGYPPWTLINKESWDPRSLSRFFPDLNSRISDDPKDNLKEPIPDQGLLNRIIAVNSMYELGQASEDDVKEAFLGNILKDAFLGFDTASETFLQNLNSKERNNLHNITQLRVFLANKKFFNAFDTLTEISSQECNTKILTNSSYRWNSICWYPMNFTKHVRLDLYWIPEAQTFGVSLQREPTIPRSSFLDLALLTYRTGKNGKQEPIYSLKKLEEAVSQRLWTKDFSQQVSAKGESIINKTSWEKSSKISYKQAYVKLCGVPFPSTEKEKEKRKKKQQLEETQSFFKVCVTLFLGVVVLSLILLAKLCCKNPDNSDNTIEEDSIAQIEESLLQNGENKGRSTNGSNNSGDRKMNTFSPGRSHRDSNFAASTRLDEIDNQQQTIADS